MRFSFAFKALVINSALETNLPLTLPFNTDFLVLYVGRSGCSF